MKKLARALKSEILILVLMNCVPLIVMVHYIYRALIIDYLAYGMGLYWAR